MENVDPETCTKPVLESDREIKTSTASTLPSGKKRIIENIFSLAVLQATNYLLPLITFPYLVRVLGPEKLGMIAFAQAFVQYFVVLTDYGFNLSATRQVAICREDPNEVSRVFCSVMGAKLGLMILGFMIMSVIVFTVPKFRTDWLLYYITYMMVLGNALFPGWVFQGLEKMKYVTIVNAVAKIVGTMAVFVFVRSQSNYLAAAGIQSGILLAAGVIGLACLRSITPIRYSLPKLKDMVHALREGGHIFLLTASVSLYTTSNLVVLGLLTNSTTVGYFSAADKLVKAVQSLLTCIHTAMYPHVSALALRSREAALKFNRRVLRLVGMLGLVATLVVLFSAKPIVAIVLGSEYSESIMLLRLMAPLLFIIAVTNVFGTLTMFTFGLDRLASKIVLFAGIANVIYIWPLVYTFGAVGAAVAVLTTEVLVMLACGHSLQRRGFGIVSLKINPQ